MENTTETSSGISLTKSGCKELYPKLVMLYHRRDMEVDIKFDHTLLGSPRIPELCEDDGSD